MSPHSAETAEVAHVAPVFAALGDQTRLALVSRLSLSGPQSIARLTSGSEVTRQAVTKHLEVLASAGLIRDVRSGRERIWEINPDQIAETSHYLDRISKGWDEALQRLRTFVEE